MCTKWHSILFKSALGTNGAQVMNRIDDNLGQPACQPWIEGLTASS
jgi:hypothetical protein